MKRLVDAVRSGGPGGPKLGETLGSQTKLCGAARCSDVCSADHDPSIDLLDLLDYSRNLIKKPWYEYGINHGRLGAI